MNYCIRPIFSKSSSSLLASSSIVANTPSLELASVTIDYFERLISCEPENESYRWSERTTMGKEQLHRFSFSFSVEKNGKRKWIFSALFGKEVSAEFVFNSNQMHENSNSTENNFPKLF
jgi:hypothetical protein